MRLKPVLSLALGLLALPAHAENSLTTVAYHCDRGALVQATYINTADSSFAVVAFEARQIGFTIAPSGSGARYESADPAQPFVWWTKGDSAMLLFGAEDTPIYSDCAAG